jgi:8-oxo-dGTP pyrophosphatase MutT (NUDIX family)
MSAVTPHTRHMTASVVVIDPDTRKVLLVFHNATGKLMFPGGHVDPDETPAEAALREVEEETGLRPTLVRLRPPWPLPGMVEVPAPWVVYQIPAPAKPHKGEPAHHHIDELFVGVAGSAQPLRARLAEVSSAAWYPIAGLGGLVGAQPRAEVPEVASAALRALEETRDA